MNGIRRLAGLFVALLAVAATAAPPVVTLEAGMAKTHEKTKDRGNIRQMQIDITVRNTSNTNAPVTLEWYVVSSPVAASGYYISQRGSEELKLKPMEVAKRPQTVRLFKEKDVGNNTIQFVSEVKGYVVRLMRDGKQLAYKAEPTFIARKVEKPAEFQQLLNAQGP